MRTRRRAEGIAAGRGADWTRLARQVSAIAAGALLCTAVPLPASAAPITAFPVVSQGEGRLLTAELLNSGVDALLALDGAQAVNQYGTGNVSDDTPLDVNALSALNLQVGTTNLFGINGIIQLGAAGQYAGADDDASSVAFSGTVSEAGSLIGVGTVTPGPGLGDPLGHSALVSVTTTQLLGGGTDLVDLVIGVGAVAAGANQTTTGVQAGGFVIADLQVQVGGTLVEEPVGTIQSAVSPLIDAVNVFVEPDIVSPLMGGTVTVDLDDLLAVAGVAQISELAPGTNLLQYAPAAVVAKITTLTTALLAVLAAGIPAGPAGTAATVLLQGAQDVISPLLTGLSASLSGPLGAAIDALVQLDVNNTSTVAGTFTQNALTVGLGTEGALARVGLANASVGPNAGLDGVLPAISGLVPDNGPETGGTAVIITGTGFTGATGVLFDASPGTSVVVDDTTITVVSPAHPAGPVEVRVLHPNGPSGPLGFTYVRSALSDTGLDASPMALAALGLIAAGGVLLRRRPGAA